MLIKKAKLFFTYVSLFNLPKFKDIEKALIDDNWDRNRPKYREGLSPSLRLLSFLWKEEKEKDINILIPKDYCIKAKLKLTIRLCRYGALIHSYELAISHQKQKENKKKVTSFIEDIISCLAIVRRTENGLGVQKITNGRKEKTLYDMYLVSRNKFERQLKERGVELLSPELVNDKSNRSFESQNPYVLTAIELDGEGKKELPWWENPPPWKKMCSDNNGNFTIENSLQNESKETTKNWQKTLAILLRLVDGQDYFKNGNLSRIRLPGDKNIPNYSLENYSWDSRLYMAFHPRSSLVMSYDLDKPPTDFMLPTLLEMLEILRSHWYSAIIISTLFDEEIEKIQDDGNQLSYKILEKIVLLRKLWASNLNDPATYNFEYGSVTKIALDARNQMGLDHLKELTFRKIELLDKIIDDQMRLDRLHAYQEFEKE